MRCSPVIIALITTVVARDSVLCPSTDDKKNALLKQIGAVEDGTISCLYRPTGRCDYDVAGPVSSGANDCPDSLAQGDPAEWNPPSPPDCADTDKKGVEVVIIGGPDIFGLSCEYIGGAGVCDYFLDGSLDHGSADCPRNSTDTGTGNVPRLSCPDADDEGSALVSQGGPDEDGLTCIYGNAGSCSYFSNGNFESGSSSCPDVTTGTDTTSSITSPTASPSASPTESPIETSTTSKPAPTRTPVAGDKDGDGIPDTAVRMGPGVVVGFALLVAALMA